jgi:hypothetical protein
MVPVLWAFKEEESRKLSYDQAKILEGEGVRDRRVLHM